MRCEGLYWEICIERPVGLTPTTVARYRVLSSIRISTVHIKQIIPLFNLVYLLFCAYFCAVTLASGAKAGNTGGGMVKTVGGEERTMTEGSHV